ncbi:MAG TPA: LysR family transcriptional regulator [Bacteroidales bacterium]|nr:LysR family transcriptional regulator [Bacteroidales bacterium]
MEIKLKYKIWLETDEKAGVLGDGKWRLLKAIDETGCLNNAMKKLGLSYRKTWDNLVKIEEMLGFKIVEKQRGGATGGNTVLTKEGKLIVNAFDRFHAKYDELITEGLEEMLTEIKQGLKK